MFSKRIKELREENRLSQEELGKKIGLSSNTISTYERGYRQPTLDNLKKIAIILDVTTDYLLGLTDKKNKLNTLEEEEYVLNLFRQLPEQIQSEIKGQMRGIVMALKKNYKLYVT